MTWTWQIRVSIIKSRLKLGICANCFWLSTVSLFEVWRWGLKPPAGSSWGTIILVNTNGSWAGAVKEEKSSGSNLLSGPMRRRRRLGLWMKERGLFLISFSPGTWWQGKKRKKKQITESVGLRKSKVLSAGYQDSTKCKGTGLEGKEADSFCICFCSEDGI